MPDMKAIHDFLKKTLSKSISVSYQNLLLSHIPVQILFLIEREQIMKISYMDMDTFISGDIR